MKESKMHESKEEKSKLYGIYLRVSTSEQARQKEGSLQSQLQRIQEFLRYKYGDVQQLVYKDEGLSGKDTNRPEFQRLTDDIKSGLVHAVACTEISRISRSVIDFHQFIDLCNKYEVVFISMREQFDTLTSQSKLILSIFASVAQFEREQISERTSANLQARARRGLYNGGYLYGYKPRREQKGYLDADPQEAMVINIIFDQYIETGSYCLVAEYINKQGHQTRQYTTRKGKVHPGIAWSKSSILQILKNPAYIGQRRAGDEIVKAVWSPIVSLDKWQKVQEILAQNLECRGNKVEPRGHAYIFTGLIRCMHCNIILENGSGTGRNGELHYYYRHPSKHKKADCPFPTNLPADQVESFLYKKLTGLLDDDELLNMVCADVQNRNATEQDNLEKQIRFTEKELKDIESQITGYAKKILFLDNEDIQTIIAPMVKELRERRKTLEEKRQELKARLSMLAEQFISPEDIKGEMRILVNEFDTLEAKQKQRIMRLLVEKVEMYRDRFKVFVYVYKQNTHPNLMNQVRMSTNGLPRLRSSRTTSNFYALFFFHIQISYRTEILLYEYTQGDWSMRLYRLLEDGKIIAYACDFGEYVAVYWKSKVPSIQIYRSIEELRYISGGKNIQDIGEIKE